MTDRIEKTIELKASPERVWQALTDHEEFGQWFRVKLDGPFVPGALSNGHMTWPGYEHVKWRARVLRMDRPSLFSFSWHPYAIDPEVDYSAEPETVVEFRIEPNGAGTRLTVTEAGFDALPPHRQPEALRMNSSGWATQLENVRVHVDG